MLNTVIRIFLKIRRLTCKSSGRLSPVLVCISLTIIFPNACRKISSKGKFLHVKILQTTDIHAHLRFHEIPAPSGWFGLANIMEKERHKEEKNGRSLLLIDCGDTSQGTYIGAFTHGKVGVEMLNQLKYTCWIPGNHDFDYGPDILKQLICSFKYDCLAANLIFFENSPKNLFPWKLYNINSLKIAVIGLTYPYLDRDLWGHKLKGFKIISFQQALDNYFPKIMAVSPNAIIVAVHFGRYIGYADKRNNLDTIVKTYPQIDLILGGHTHKDISGEKIPPDTWFVQAGKYAEKLAVVDMVFDAGNKMLENITSHLIPVTENICDNKYIKSRLFSYLKATKKDKWTLIMRKPSIKYPLLCEYYHLLIRNKEETHFSKRIKDSRDPMSYTKLLSLFVCKAMASALIQKPEGVIFGLSQNAHMLKFPLYNCSVFSFYPFEDTICTLYLTFSELKQIIEEQETRKYKGFYQYIYGVKILKHKDGDIYAFKLMNGKIFKGGTKRVRVAFSSYALAGAGGKFPLLKEIASRPSSLPADSGISIRKSIKVFLVR